eukprot:4284995-Karenia_brevis.AAC.1
MSNPPPHLADATPSPSSDEEIDLPDLKDVASGLDDLDVVEKIFDSNPAFARKVALTGCGDTKGLQSDIKKIFENNTSAPACP